MIDMVSLSYALKALNGGGSEEIEKEIENLSLDVLDKAVLGFSIPKEMPIRNYIYPYNVGYPAYFMRVDRVDLGELDYTYDAERNAYVTEIPMCIETSSGPAVNVYLYGWESIEAHNGEWKRNTMAINTYGDGTSTFQDTFPQSIDPIYFKNSMKGSYLYFERYPYLLRIPEYDNVLSNFAKEYSPSKEYEPGEFCVYLNKTYMARVTTKGNMPYISGSSTQWLMVDIASLIGAAYGMASLDGNGRIPYSQLPESAMEFKGSWNASTNTPTLTQGTGTNGDFYIVSVGGTWEGIEFAANDRIIFDGNQTLWIRLPAGNEVDARETCLDFNSDGTFSISALYNGNPSTSERATLYYSRDLITWNKINNSTVGSSLGSDGRYHVYLRGEDNTFISTSNLKNMYISFSQVRGTAIRCDGNIETLLNYKKAIKGEYVGNIPNFCFYALFANNAKLESVPRLPRTELSPYCYWQMFYGCTGIRELPENFLPAKTLYFHCYDSMFRGCTGLKSLPNNLMSAETLAESCCNMMFYECTGLKSLGNGVLPAMTLAKNCYNAMFASCSSIKSIPNDYLPAVDLEEGCYNSMFSMATSLEIVPKNLLPAKTLKKDCYIGMFNRSSIRPDCIPNLMHVNDTTGVDTNCMSNLFANTGLACSTIESARSIPWYGPSAVSSNYGMFSSDVTSPCGNIKYYISKEDY